jgi:acyl-CoA dehydrogenase
MSAHRSPQMNADLDALRELARAFHQKEVQPHIDELAGQHRVDPYLCNKAGDLGPLCLSIPEEYGGGTFAREVVMIEEQGRVADSAWGASLQSAIVAPGCFKRLVSGAKTPPSCSTMCV